MIFDYLIEYVVHFLRWLTLPSRGLWVGIGLTFALCLVFSKGGVRAVKEQPRDRLPRALLSAFAWTLALPFLSMAPQHWLTDIPYALERVERSLNDGTVIPLAGALLLGAALLVTWPRRLRAIAIAPRMLIWRGLKAGLVWLVLMAVFFFGTKPIGVGGGGGQAAQAGGGAANAAPVPSDIVYEPIPEQPEMAETADALVITFRPRNQGGALSERDGVRLWEPLVCVIRDELYLTETELRAPTLANLLQQIDVALVAALAKRDGPPKDIGVLRDPYPGEFALRKIVEVAAKHLPLQPDGRHAQPRQIADTKDMEAWLTDLRVEEAE